MAFPDGWVRRCALVIQSGQVTDNEVNFPLLVTEDTLPSEVFDADGSYPALNGGGDIRFSSDEAGNTQLACEIESFITDNDPANGKAAIWVKVPSLSSSTNTTIYIWYNKAGESQPAEDNAYGKENVWDANFKMVQHMNQTPDGTADEMVDSTSNDNDGTTYNMDSADQVAGQIDGSLDFDGVGDYVSVTDSASLDITGALSISLWINYIDLIGDNGGLISKSADIATRKIFSISPYKVYELGILNDVMYFQIGDGTNIGQLSYSATSLEDNQWHNVVVIWNGTTNTNGMKLYYEGNLVAQATSANSAIQSIGSILDIACGSVNSDFPFNGIIDEVRISNVARTAGWIATEYNNQNAPSTFLIEGTPEIPGAAPITFIPQIIMF